MKRLFSYRIELILLISLLLTAPGLAAQSLFLENKGRMPAFVTYTKQTGSGMVYYTLNGYSMLMHDNSQYDSLWQHIHTYKRLKKDFTVNWHRLDMEFIGSLKPEIKAESPSPTIYNFYKGNSAAKWYSGLREYRELRYLNLYPGIDWEILQSGSLIKHNFIVHKNSDSRLIQFRYSHVDNAEIVNGHLLITVSVGKVMEQKPYAFQILNKDTVPVECAYELSRKGDGYEVGFKVGAYNKELDLIIDPVLVFSTYSGSQGDNFGFTATYDSRSHLYAGGIVDGGTGTDGGPFPITPGAFQTVYAGGVGQSPANLPCDIGINKYDSAGTVLLYSTYLGGSKDEYPHSLVADHKDNLLIMGTSYSPDFPVETLGYDDTFNGSTDIFVFKLSPDGSSMLGGTYIGGSGTDGLNTQGLRYNYADDFRGDIVVDTADNIYVASTTNSINFPVKNAFQTSRASFQDGCVFSMDKDLKSLRFSTFLGGNFDDAMYSIRMYDTFIFVGGGTSSAAMAFPVNGNKNSYTGSTDGFIAKLNLGGALINSTYFGTIDYDQIYFLDIDASGRVYAAGQTEGNIPRTPGTYGKDNTSQFIVRFSPNISTLNLSTTFGARTNDPEISPSAFLVDKCNNIYFSGWGSPINHDGLHSLTTRNLTVTTDAIQDNTDNNDFYLLVLGKDARKLLHATYYGGNQTEDHVDGGTSRFDKKGVVYQSVCSSCPEPFNHYNDFPVSANAPFKTNLSPRCSNASFKIDFQINFQVDAKFTANPTVGCAPLRVFFTNQSKSGREYFWDFGDGSPIDTNKNPEHTFVNAGTYKVRLTTVDSFSCNISEMDSILITVNESPKADFEFSSEECSKEFSFKNKSENYNNPEWDFGDSSGINKDNDPAHTFMKDGFFKVVLSVTHPVSGCTDTQTAVLQYYGDPKHSLKIPNVFTPNGDSTNECFTIGGINPNCDEAEIWVYDRWGILVYNGVLPLDCWNGSLKNNGDLLPDGTYYFIMFMRYKDIGKYAMEKIAGTIRIIR